MKRYAIILLLILPEVLFAQAYYQDALRFSHTQPQGSARIQALGGASVALGADPSSLISNPAGLGLYNRSELAITPTFNSNQSKATLNGITTNVNRPKLSLDQVSGVFHQPKDGNGGWLGGSWGFGVQKMNDFNSKTNYSGVNHANSLIDYFIENADGSTTSDFPNLEDAFDLTSLAYYNYLIGPWNIIDTLNFPNNEYFSDVTSFYRPSLKQKESIETSGSQYQISMGYGGNFADVLYFGINLGLVTIKYEMLKNYEESNFDYSKTDSTTYLPLNSFIATEKLNIDGTGANLTLGIIIRPDPAFRIGASITTPTAYAINDSYETTMGANWNNFYYGDLIGGDTLLNSTYVESAIIQSFYTIKTPMQYSLGAAFFYNKLGFVTLDAEFKDYSNVNLTSQEFSMQSDNDYLQTNYSNQINIRAGAELRLSSLRVRGGYAITNPPNDKQNGFTSISQTFSGGVGILLEKFYADFALIYNNRKSTYSPYLLFDYSEPIIEINQNRIKGVLSLGVKF